MIIKPFHVYDSVSCSNGVATKIPYNETWNSETKSGETICIYNYRPFISDDSTASKTIVIEIFRDGHLIFTDITHFTTQQMITLTKPIILNEGSQYEIKVTQNSGGVATVGLTLHGELILE